MAENETIVVETPSRDDEALNAFKESMRKNHEQYRQSCLRIKHQSYAVYAVSAVVILVHLGLLALPIIKHYIAPCGGA